MRSGKAIFRFMTSSCKFSAAFRSVFSASVAQRLSDLPFSDKISRDFNQLNFQVIFFLLSDWSMGMVHLALDLLACLLFELFSKSSQISSAGVRLIAI